MCHFRFEKSLDILFGDQLLCAYVRCQTIDTNKLLHHNEMAMYCVQLPTLARIKYTYLVMVKWKTLTLDIKNFILVRLKIIMNS